MNTKTKLVLLTTMVSLLLLASNFTASQGVLGSWDVGTFVTFTVYTNNRNFVRDNVENVASTTITETSVGLDFNITSVNNVTGEVYYDIFDLGGGVSTQSYDYLMDDFIGTYSSLNILLSANYQYDQGRNQTVLYNYGIHLDTYFFIEANWT
ncbi:MAG: hypothetical protein ACTSP5_11375, partial [Candidatus Heimdallarchaeota archaeon]